MDLVYADLNIAYLVKGQFTSRQYLKVDDRGNLDVLVRGPFWPKNNSWGFARWIERFVDFVDHYLIHNTTPDLIHAHTYLGAIIAHQIKFKYQIPFVTTLHYSGWMDGSIRTLHQNLAIKALNNCNHILPVSRALFDHVKDICTSDHLVIPNFIDQDLFTLPESPIPPAPFTLLSVGDLIERKNWITLIDIFAGFAQEIPESRLVIIGEGPLRNKLEARIDHYGLKDQIHLPGMVHKSRIPSFYHQSHAYVHSSKIESFGITLLEALYCGLPVVAFDNGPTPEIVTKESGMIVPPGDNASFVNALIHLHENLTVYHPARIRRSAIDNFGMSSVIRKLNHVYQQVLGTSI